TRLLGCPLFHKRKETRRNQKFSDVIRHV
ncbi:unnamed protein product, partial [Arctia plantaginis]